MSTRGILGNGAVYNNCINYMNGVFRVILFGQLGLNEEANSGYGGVFSFQNGYKPYDG